MLLINFSHLLWCVSRCVPRRDCPHAHLVARWQSRVSGSSNQCTAINDVIPSHLLSLSRALNVSLTVKKNYGILIDLK